MTKKQINDFLVAFRDIDSITAALDTYWWENPNSPSHIFMSYGRSIMSKELYNIVYKYLYDRIEEWWYSEVIQATWPQLCDLADLWIIENHKDWFLFTLDTDDECFWCDDVWFVQYLEIMGHVN